ncbi:MAG TPA: hypothetical protein VE994_03340 [Terriglobales bacterium]|nr:hypothetical protein [Terriglobales bacterium]
MTIFVSGGICGGLIESSLCSSKGWSDEREKRATGLLCERQKTKKQPHTGAGRVDTTISGCVWSGHRKSITWAVVEIVSTEKFSNY